MKQCIKCGAPIDDNAEFCPNCGAPQGAQPQQAPPVNAAYTPQQTPQPPLGQVQGAYPPQYGTVPQNPSQGFAAPAPKNGIFQSYALFWKNYVNFSGRSRRSDYWNVFLVNMIISAALGIFMNIAVNISGGESQAAPVLVVYAIAGLYSAASLIPGLALTVRRLNDIGKSWGYIFFALIPLVGEIILLVYMCTDSQMMINAHGPSPKYPGANQFAPGVAPQPGPAYYNGNPPQNPPQGPGYQG